MLFMLAVIICLRILFYLQAVSAEEKAHAIQEGAQRILKTLEWLRKHRFMPPAQAQGVATYGKPPLLQLDKFKIML